MADWHAAYRDEGICILKDFVRPECLPILVEEATKLLPIMHQHSVEGNAYLTALDSSVDEQHPKRMTETTRTSTIACDQIPKGAAFRQIYDSPAMDQLVKSIVGHPHVFHYDCPMGAVNVAVMEDGDYLRWHFDQSEFVVSLHLQDPEAGGHYEYVRDIRSESEPRYDSVRSVLLGGRDGVQTLGTEPGSLLVFRGRNTIHRVTKVSGKLPRLVLLLAYTLEKGVGSSDFLLNMRYGRTTPWGGGG